MSANRPILISCVAAIAMTLLGGVANAQPVYSVLDLGRASEPAMPPEPYCSTCSDQTVMNASGQLVTSRLLANADSYFWEPGLAAPILIDTQSDDMVRAVAISSNGYVAGTSDGGAAVPFVWSRATRMKVLCCADYYYPLGVNASGVVVGTQFFGGYHAVIWDNGPIPRFIDDIQIAGGAPWVGFDQARTISDAGIIAGVGRLRAASGAIEPHYFVLTPIAGPRALDRSDWTVTVTESAAGDPPRNAIDGDLNTRFSTGNAQHDSQGFKVSWPGDRTINRIRIEVGPSANDFPRTCGIWVKDVAGTVTFVDCVADGSGIVDVSFSPVAVHTIEVWQWGVSTWWWSIAEFNAYRP